MKPGDVLEWNDDSATSHRWRVVGIHLGGRGQEGIVEMQSITHRPGRSGPSTWHERVFVPEVLTRSLRNVSSSIDQLDLKLGEQR